MQYFFSIMAGVAAAILTMRITKLAVPEITEGALSNIGVGAGTMVACALVALCWAINGPKKN